MKTIRILMYHGPHGNSTGFERSLRYCNQNSLLPGFVFRISRSSFISDSVLRDSSRKYRFDVVMFPGGNYRQGRNGEGCDVSSVRRFVKQGGGYYGTCGGCGAAIHRIIDRDGSTYANSPDGHSLQLLPRLRAEQGWYTGYFCGRLTAAGTRITGYGGEQISMVGKGPYLFYPNGHPRGYVDLLHPTNNHRNNRGRKAWVDGAESYQVKYDTYGNSREQFFRSLVSARFGRGRVIVGQPHVEYFSRSSEVWYPRWVAGGVVWAAGYAPSFGSYVLGSDRGEHKLKVQDKGLKRFHQPFVAQQEVVTHRGAISVLRVLHAGKGKISMHLFAGDRKPEKTLSNSSTYLVRCSRRQWLTIALPKPVLVREGQRIWIAVRIKNKAQALYYKRYWAFGKGTIERKSYTTKPMDFVVSMYARVDFMQS